MALPFQFEVTALGLAASLAAIVGGAPLFAEGLRAVRQRRTARALAPGVLASDTAGVVLARGQVLPDAALVAPLSGRICAGWELEVQGVHTRLAGRAAEYRDFTIESGETLAEVETVRAQWKLPVTAERTLAAKDALEAALARAFESNAELKWLRGLGVPLRLTERALLAGGAVHVLAHAEMRAAEVEVLRTGSDDAPLEVGGPALHLVAGESLERVRVSVDAPSSTELAPPAWHSLAAFAGPALMLAGLAYLLAALQRGLSGNLG